MLRTVYLCLHQELEKECSTWRQDDVEFQTEPPSDASVTQRASRFRSGSFYFRFPGHKTTMVTFKVPSNRSYAEAQWIINSPNSPYHPGRHTGRLVFPSDFPISRPHIIWDSPILSAFVKKGRVCIEYDWQRQSFYNILRGLAAVVIFGPELDITTDPTALAHQYRCRPHEPPRSPTLLTKESDDADKDWMMRVTNFFSRAYNRIDDDGEAGESRQIAVIERETSLKAIADFQRHIGIGTSTKDPSVTFKQVNTLRELQ